MWYNPAWIIQERPDVALTRPDEPNAIREGDTNGAKNSLANRVPSDNRKGFAMSKQCQDCKAVKDESEFYRNNALPDGLDIYCKECRKARRVNNTGELTPSTKLALEALALHGVPAEARTSGIDYNWAIPAYCDIVAFSLVTIEAKACFIEPLQWVWSSENPEKEDIVMLGDFTGQSPLWYVLSNDSPIFYHDGYYGRGAYDPALIGQRKKGVSITDGNADDFRAAHNNFAIIRRQLQEKCALLESGQLARPFDVDIQAERARSRNGRDAQIAAGQLELFTVSSRPSNNVSEQDD